MDGVNPFAKRDPPSKTEYYTPISRSGETMTFFRPQKQKAASKPAASSYGTGIGDDCEAVDVTDTVPEAKIGQTKNSRESTRPVEQPRGDISERERALKEREEQLRRREAELGMVEREIKHLKPNWPFEWYAIEYHDIDEEIPSGKKAMMKRLYMNLLMTWGALFINWIAMLGIWFSGDQSGPSYTLWGTMYLIGIPGAWKLWYRPIYFAYRDKTTLRYFCFVISFAFHCFFVVVMALGLPNCAAGGLMTMVQQFAVGNPKSAFVTFLAMIGWGATAILSVLNFKKVQNEWGKEGVDMTSITQQLRNEVRDTLGPVAAEVVRGSVA